MRPYGTVDDSNGDGLLRDTIAVHYESWMGDETERKEANKGNIAVIIPLSSLFCFFKIMVDWWKSIVI